MIDSNSTTSSENSAPAIYKAPYSKYFRKVQEEKVDHFVAEIFQKLKDFSYQIVHKFLGFILMPSQFIPKFLLKSPKQSLLQRGGEEVKLRTADNIQLDGMYFHGKGCNPSDRTVILFNPNGASYEMQATTGIPFPISVWQYFGWNVLLFNNRGVGESEGRVTCDGLILDGDAIYHYVRDTLHVPKHKIHLHGHSMGGAEVAEVAGLHPKSNVCNDRSYSSLSAIIKGFLGGGRIGAIVSKIFVYFGWEYKAHASWNHIQGMKIVVCVENDPIIGNKPGFYNFFAENKEKGEEPFSILYDKNGFKICAGNAIPDTETIKEKMALFSNTYKFSSLSLVKGPHIRHYSPEENSAYMAIIDGI